MIWMEDISMAKVAMAEARSPHENRRFANSGVSIKAASPAARVALRANAKEVSKLTKPLGLKLPTSPMSSTISKSRSALWLGPDEWLIIDQVPSSIQPLMKNLGSAKCSHVDVSHRNTAIIVSGKDAENILNAGCPRDLSLSAFPVGGCSRTIFGKIEIILWRKDSDTFHIEVWRSFSDYLWTYLLDAAKSNF
jgi:sarcosine oxidase subunit gamma